MNFALRWPAGVVTWIWLAWLAAAAALTARPFFRHVEYFKSPGPRFYQFFLAALPSLVLVLVVYAWVRRRGIWRYELAAGGAAGLGGCLLYEPRATLVTLWIFLACYGSGRRLQQRFRLDTPDHAGEIAIPAGLGFGLLIFALFWMGLAGIYYWWSFAALLAAASAAFRREIRQLGFALQSLHRSWGGAEELGSPLGGVLVVFGALFLASAMMVVLSPSVAFDVLKMHLPSAQYYAAIHALRPLPLLDYSYFPQSVETLMAMAYTLAGQAGAQMLPPVFFGLTCMLLWAVLRRLGADLLGALAGVMGAASLPFLHWTGSAAKNDLALALFQLAALDCYLRWRAGGNFNWIRAGVFFLALSFGVKHVALFGAIPLGLFFAGAVWRQRRRLPAAISLALLLAAFGLIWHIRTWALAGNPVYPETLARSTTVAISSRPLGPGEKIMRYISVPWRVHFEGRWSFESPLNNPMGVVLVVFGPLWLLVRRKETSVAERFCLAFILIYVAYWAGTYPILRYASAPIALLVGLTLARLPALDSGLAAWSRPPLGAALSYTLLFGLCGTLIVEVNGPQLGYFARRLDRAGYLGEALRTYRSLEFLDGVAGPQARVFGVDNCSCAYAPNPANMQCDLNRSGRYSAQDAARIHARLLGGGYHFLILPRTEFGHGLLEALKPSLGAQEIHQDSYFAVYRLSARP